MRRCSGSQCLSERHEPAVARFFWLSFSRGVACGRWLGSAECVLVLDVVLCLYSYICSQWQYQALLFKLLPTWLLAMRAAAVLAIARAKVLGIKHQARCWSFQPAHNSAKT